MRVGFDAKRLYNNFTGLGNYSRTLVRNLGCFFPQDEYVLYSPKAPLSAETVFFRENFATHTHKGPFSSLWRAGGITRDLKRHDIDIYHGLSHDMPLWIEKLKMGKVVTIHDVCYKTFPDMFPYVERMIYDQKYRHACRVADKIIAISDSTKKDIVELLGVDSSKIEVIHQAINPTFYNPQPLDHCRALVARYGVHDDYVLYVGSINSRKNLLGVLKAYTLLPASVRLPLVVIGSGGKYKAQCLDFADKNGLLPLMIMLDGIESMATLQAFYQCATMMVYPSFYEGFGLPVTEALLSGTPVVTSHVSSLPEAGGGAASYVDPHSAEDIALSIERVLGSKQLREEMVRTGLRYATENFSQQALTAKVHDLYKTLL